MARKYDVTRNFEIYEVSMVLYNDSTEMTEKKSVTVDNKDITKKALENYVVDTYGAQYTLVKFTVECIGSVMFGMTSTMFRKYGVRLNPENRQPYASTENENGTENDTQDGTQDETYDDTPDVTQDGTQENE